MINRLLMLFFKGLVVFREKRKYSWLSIGAIATVLLIFHIFFIVGMNVNSFFGNISQIKSVRVYIGGVEQSGLIDLISDINNMQEVERSIYYSGSDAKKHLMKSMRNVKYIESIADEFFPSFIEVSIKSEFRQRESLAKLTDVLKSKKGVLNASYGEEVIDTVAKYASKIRAFVFVLGCMLMFCTLFILHNMVTLNMYALRDEVYVYRIVGAGTGFIVAIYSSTAFIQAILGTTLSLICAKILLFLFGSNALFSFITLSIGWGYIFTIYFVVSISSIATGIFSARSFIRRVN